MATARGTRAARRAYWQRQIEAHRRSGLSRAAYCTQRGPRQSTLSVWKWKLAREANPASRRDSAGIPGASSGPPFIPVQLAARTPAREGPARRPAPPGGVDIELTLRAGHRLRLRGRVDAAWLVQILGGLEGVAC